MPRREEQNLIHSHASSLRCEVRMTAYPAEPNWWRWVRARGKNVTSKSSGPIPPSARPCAQNPPAGVMPMTPSAKRATSSLPPPWAGEEPSPSAVRSRRNSNVSRTAGSSAPASSHWYPPEREAAVGSPA